MTLFPVALFLIAVFSAGTRFIVLRSWKPALRFAVLAILLFGLPGLLWLMVLGSPGSGWFFGLLALIVTATSLFGAVMGWIWLSLTR